MARYLDDLLSLDDYNPATIVEKNMDDNCEHNYEKETITIHDDYAKAKCTKCNGILIIEVYN